MTNSGLSAFDGSRHPFRSALRSHGSAGVGYAAFVAAALVFCWPTVLELVSQWTGSSSFRHGFIVAPIALALALRVRSEGAARPSWPAFAGLGAAALLWVAGRIAEANLVEEVALVLLLIAGVGAFFGAEALRRRAFPLAFLFFMVPAGVSLLPALQSIAAVAASAFLTAAGISHERAGVVIVTAVGGFRIAESCAGLNFLLAALMVSTLFAHLRGLDWRYGALFALFAAALAILANGFRVFAVIAISTWSGGSIKIAADHFAFSLGLYGAFVLALAGVGVRLKPARRP
jgi:exosortase